MHVGKDDEAPLAAASPAVLLLFPPLIIGAGGIVARRANQIDDAAIHDQTSMAAFFQCRLGDDYGVGYGAVTSARMWIRFGWACRIVISIFIFILVIIIVIVIVIVAKVFQHVHVMQQDVGIHHSQSHGPSIIIIPSRQQFPQRGHLPQRPGNETHDLPGDGGVRPPSAASASASAIAVGNQDGAKAQIVSQIPFRGGLRDFAAASEVVAPGGEGVQGGKDGGGDGRAVVVVVTVAVVIVVVGMVDGHHFIVGGGWNRCHSYYCVQMSCTSISSMVCNSLVVQQEEAAL
mmetsp:Transcript_1115/g.2361  ORF Transcript_1115/g.2361 Transcript_1115/m.2361 type:complete len:289 (-) Transcript_1115:70-936(-)